MPRLSGLRVRIRSGASAKLVQLAAVALGRAGLGRGREVEEGLALLGKFFSRFAAGFRFLVEGLREGSGSAGIAEGEDVDFELAAFGANLQAVADVDVAAGLDGLAGTLNAVEFAGAGGLGAGLEEARGP